MQNFKVDNTFLKSEVVIAFNPSPTRRYQRNVKSDIFEIKNLNITNIQTEASKLDLNKNEHFSKE